MNSQTPYAESPKSVYGETKIEAEKLVLAANDGLGLSTCAIRADGIYGPELNLILDQLVEQAAKGLLRLGIGSPSTIQDKSYVDNLVHGEILAAENLANGGVARGRAYFISDEAPQNAFEFLRPYIEGLGIPFPKHRIPRWLIRPILVAWEHAHFRLGIPAPFPTPHELDKVTVTHYGTIEDARRDLGYEPVKSYEQAVEECLPYCKALFRDALASRGRTM